MYINLPSKNHYRRPASYTSKGYRTRRLAVDFAVPLITNVKCAKLLIEGLVRKMPLDVSPIDFKTSHTTYTFPGLINISAFVPGLLERGSRDFNDATRASLGGGFTTALILPSSLHGELTNSETLETAHSNAIGACHCNYAISVSATDKNTAGIAESVQSQCKALYVSMSTSGGLGTVASHFASWPAEKPIVITANGSDIASALLLASLHNRSVHISDVRTAEEINLIALSKTKDLRVTCDVSLYALFFVKEDYADAPCLPSKQDQKALWENMAVIDAFSIGRTPYDLGEHLGKAASAWSGVEEALPLLLNAASEGRLTLQDIQERLHDNPARIFGITEQGLTQVEVVVDRKAAFIPSHKSWSPLLRTSITGAVHRVVIHGQTVLLDRALFSSPIGRDISGVVVAVRSSLDRATRVSFSSSVRPTISTVADISSPPAGLKSPTTAALEVGAAQPIPLSLSHSTIQQLTSSTSRTFPLPPPHPAFHRRHILSIKQFTHQDIHDLFSLAHEMRLQVERNGTLDILKGRVLCTLFYEPSTRTSASFETAMKRLGGEVVSVSATHSSVQKGESLADTVRTLGCYGDAIVLRHPEIGSPQIAAKFSPVPILNAGDGVGEHPTQVRTYPFFIEGD